jgi:hypothetical protein
MIKNNLIKDILKNILKTRYEEVFPTVSEISISFKEYEFLLTSLFLELNILPKQNLSLVCKELGNSQTFSLEEGRGQNFISFSLIEKYKSFFSKSPRSLTKFYFNKFLYFHKKFVKSVVLTKRALALVKHIDLFVSHKEYLEQSINKISTHITIRYASNNIFCTFSNLITNKIIYATSTGREKLKASKKNLRFISKVLLQKFLEQVKKVLLELRNNTQVIQKILITLVIPKKSRKFILMLFQNFFKTGRELKAEVVLHFKENKCFNGCRPKKQQRKKRKGFKHLK